MPPTRAEVLADIKTRLTVIKNNKAYVDGKLADAATARAASDWSGAIGHLINAQSVAYNSLYWFAYRYAAPAPEYMLWYFLNNFTIEEYDLTAAGIRSAWLAEDIKGRQLTVYVLDEIRKEVWQEAMFDFTIPPAGRV